MGWWLIGAEVILIITALGGCCGGLIQIWCNAQRKSRCSRIVCCAGLFQCEREIESDELMIAEEEIELKAKQMEMNNKKKKPIIVEEENDLENQI